MNGSPIDSSISLLQRQTHHVISFAMGSPPPEAIPAAELEEAFRRVTTAVDRSVYSYGPTEGERGLRAALIEWLTQVGMQPQAEQILITAGGTQGIDLVCKLFIARGDLVVCEGPTYTNGIEIVRAYEGELAAVPTDEDGLCVEMIPEIVERHGRAPKLIYIIPNFQNPSGRTLSADRRMRLLELARNYGSVILEDDPYGALYFDTPPPPSLQELDRASGTVVSVHTFSKILAPGLRVGWVQASADVIAHMIDAKQAMDTCTNVLGQRLIAQFLADRLLDAHLERLRKLYAHRFALMLRALEEQFADLPEVSWSRPRGGFFIWVRLPGRVDARMLASSALELGVAFVPGDAFYIDAADPAVRLCFASARVDEIAEGVARLRRAVNDSMARERTTMEGGA